jgi:hypothetical protein
MHLLLGHIHLCQCHGDLPASVRSEIKADHGIAVFDLTNRAAFGVSFDDGLNEFIGHMVIIGVFDRCEHVFSKFSLTVHHPVVREFYPFPSLVTVHGIVSAYDGGYFAGGLVEMLLQVFEVTVPASWIRIPSIREGMDLNVVNAFFLANGGDGF